MARGIPFKGANRRFLPPPGDDGTVTELATFVNGHAIVSCWELDAAELDEVNRTGRVFLSVLSGRTLFPVFVGSESEVRRLVADTGPTFAADDTAPARPSSPIVFRLSREVIELAALPGRTIECVVDGPNNVQAHVIDAGELDTVCDRLA